MPQQKKHNNGAARQAAYRARCEKARQAALAAKSLPALPTMPTLPGWKRWNASFEAAREMIDRTLYEMRDYFDERSDRWQQSDRADDLRDRMKAAQKLLDALDDLEF